MAHLLNNRRHFTVRELSPNEVCGLATWIDFSDLSTHVYNGSNLSQVNDKSGFGRHVYQASAPLQPTVTTDTLTGITAAAFTNQQLAQSSSLYTVGTVFVIWRHPTASNTNYNGIAGYRSGLDASFLLPEDLPTSRIWLLSNFANPRFRLNGQTRPASENIGPSAPAANVYPDRWNIGMIAGTPNSVHQKVLQIGTEAYDPTNRRMLGGLVGEIVVFDRLLSDNEILGIEQYLNRKWGTGRVTNPQIALPVSAGLSLWLDASDAATITLDGSNTVSQWNDKSGNARHASQATTTLRPSYTVGGQINGVTCPKFDGTDDRLVTTSYSISQPTTVIIAFRPQATKLGVIVDGTTNRQRVYHNSNTLGSFAGSTFNGTLSATANATHRAVVIFNGASSSMRLNGASAGTGNPGAEGLSGGTLIGCAQGGAFFFNGMIAEICWYTDVLTSDQISSLESYMLTKWGA